MVLLSEPGSAGEYNLLTRTCPSPLLLSGCSGWSFVPCEDVALSFELLGKTEILFFRLYMIYISVGLRWNNLHYKLTVLNLFTFYESAMKWLLLWSGEINWIEQNQVLIVFWFCGYRWVSLLSLNRSLSVYHMRWWEETEVKETAF